MPCTGCATAFAIVRSDKGITVAALDVRPGRPANWRRTYAAQVCKAQGKLGHSSRYSTNIVSADSISRCPPWHASLVSSARFTGCHGDLGVLGLSCTE